MGKKAILFIVIGVVLGVALAGGGIYFMLQNGGIKAPEEPVEEEFDTTQGHRLELKEVLIPLVQVTSKPSALKADFAIIFKTPELLEKAKGLEPDIKEAIYKVFETKTADELRTKAGQEISARETMKEPLLNAIRDVFFTEEEKDAVAAVKIPSFVVQ